MEGFCSLMALRYEYCCTKGLIFCVGSDRAQGDDASCHFEDFAMVRQKCLSKGLMSCEMSITSQSSPGPIRTSHYILRTFSDPIISVCGVVSGGW
jgi:hypothetical protein